MKALKVGILSPEQQTEVYLKVTNVLRALADAEGKIDSNAALALFIQSVSLLEAFGVDREWFLAVMEMGVENLGMSVPKDLMVMGKLAQE